MTAGPQQIAYGPHPSQFGELTQPDGRTSRGTIVLLHGGFWRARFGLGLNRRQAADLAAHGFTCWNVEYRRIGAGGGWPATADDVGAALDHLSTLAVDLSTVVVVGHSAGGLLAAWLGRRASTASGPQVVPRAIVAQAAVLDLGAAVRAGLGDGAIADLLGGRPDTAPDRYRAADPLAAAPLAVPVLCVHGRTDHRVPFTQSATYHDAARRGGRRGGPGRTMRAISTAARSTLKFSMILPLCVRRRPGIVGGSRETPSMTETALAAAQRLLAQALDAVRAAAGAGASDDELVAVLGLCENVVRQVDRVTVDTVADLERRGVFAARGYRSTAGALADLLGWKRFEARRRVVAAERVTPRVGLDGAVLPARLPAPAGVFAAGGAGLRHVEAIARDQGCAHPGCDRPPSWAEVHHALPWESGGETKLDRRAARLADRPCVPAARQTVARGRRRQSRPPPVPAVRGPPAELSRPLAWRA